MIKLESNALVWGIVGNLGGGKTLTAVQMAVEAMRNGLFVVSNIVFDRSRLANDGIAVDQLYMLLGDLDNVVWDDLPCGDPRGSGGDRRVLVVLDEVAEWFDQYSSSNPKVKAFLSWLRHSSKRGQDVILIVQRQEFLAKSLRSLVARWVWVDDMAVTRMPVIKCRIFFLIPFVCQRSFDRYGNLIQSVSFIRKADYGCYYNTAQILSSNKQTYIYTAPAKRESNSLFFWWVLSVLAMLAM